MSTKPSTAARRYAEAVFQLGSRDDALDADAEGLAVATAILERDNVLDVLRNPARPLRQRIEVVDGLMASRVPEPIHKLVGLLVERGRIDRLPNVNAEYRRMLNQQRGVVEAVA